MDGESSPYVSRMKRTRKKKTFKAPCIRDEALRVQASPSLTRVMDGASSASLSSPHIVLVTFTAASSQPSLGTRQGRGFA
ncbi:unnamed protein product [Camellia sinensis]